MATINRNSIIDARSHIGKLLSTHTKDSNLAIFLSEQINLANKYDPNNWNLNFGLDGKLLRFNVGQEYCIQIYPHEVLVLCIADKLPQECKQPHDDFFFMGHTKGIGRVETTNFSKTPPCLLKVPNSIGLVFKKNISNWLSTIAESNSIFIAHAIKNTHRTYANHC